LPTRNSEDVFATHYDKGYRVWYNDGTGQFWQESRQAKVFLWLVGSGVVTIVAALFI
jgi:hypothetical protein